MPITKVPSGQERQETIEPYLIEIGALVLSWNYLHEELANLFWRVTGIPNGAIAFAIWHSTPSDLTQRKMLRAAVEVVYGENDETRERILWLLNKVDHFLAQKRNDALHAAVVLLVEPEGTKIIPQNFTNSPRADSLEGKQIIKELIWYRETADALKWDARMLRQALHPKRPQPLPEKPKMPHLVLPTNATEKPPVKRAKGRLPPHRLRIHEG
jgi:hypothetical protein